MSIQAVAWVLDQELPARPKLVLISIANHADHTNGYCWLRAETIAAEAACTSRSVYRFIGALVRNGYLRKAPRRGDDGKQRANDYWMMFGRERVEWDWKRGLEGESDDESDELPDEDAENEETTSRGVASLPQDRISHGEEVVDKPQQPVDKHAVSVGPCDNRVSRYESAEPSKSKSEKDARALEGVASGLVSGPPRTYRPPPPAPEQPMGAIIADREAKQIFVYQGSRAWDAWVKYKRDINGIHWSLTTTSVVDGRRRIGWYFPSLFPPSSTGPPPPSITGDDDEFMKQQGLG